MSNKTYVKYALLFTFLALCGVAVGNVYWWIHLKPAEYFETKYGFHTYKCTNINSSTLQIRNQLSCPFKYPNKPIGNLFTCYCLPHDCCKTITDEYPKVNETWSVAIAFAIILSIFLIFVIPYTFIMLCVYCCCLGS